MNAKAALFVTVLLVAASAVGAVSLFPSAPTHVTGNSGLRTFQSFAQLENFITTGMQGFRYQGIFNGELKLATPVAAGAQSVSLQSASFTSTNIQVEGVDEPDTVKTDGTYLFVGSGSYVLILKAYPPNQTQIVSTLKQVNSTVLGILLSPGRLAVIDTTYARNPSALYYTNSIEVLLYDISNVSSPQLMKTIAIEGNYINARMTDGYIYTVVQQPTFQFDSNGNATAVPPTVAENGVSETLVPSKVYYAPDSISPVNFYTMVSSIRVSDGQQNSVATLTGYASGIYASTSNVYITYANAWVYPLGFLGGPVRSPPFFRPSSINTTIIRVSYSAGDVSVQAEGRVPGTILNQFSMDEHNSYFRVATTGPRATIGSFTQVTGVYVLNQNLTVVGSLENIAPGENLYAVRFLGDFGYVVTFQRVDPLFVISFQNPTKPAILSALKVPGFSDYLHPIGSGFLIGVGKDAVASSNGDFAWYLGIKFSLFHVFDNGSSTEVANYKVGDRGSDSPALYDHKAFTYDSSRNIMVVPVLAAYALGTVVPGEAPPYGSPAWQGALVFQVSTQDGFTLLGKITQIPNNETAMTGYDYYISRSMIIGDYVYTISNKLVLVTSLSTFASVGEVQLPASYDTGKPVPLP